MYGPFEYGHFCGIYLKFQGCMFFSDFRFQIEILAHPVTRFTLEERRHLGQLHAASGARRVDSIFGEFWGVKLELETGEVVRLVTQGVRCRF